MSGANPEHVNNLIALPFLCVDISGRTDLDYLKTQRDVKRARLPSTSEARRLRERSLNTLIRRVIRSNTSPECAETISSLDIRRRRNARSIVSVGDAS